MGKPKFVLTPLKDGVAVVQVKYVVQVVPPFVVYSNEPVAIGVGPIPPHGTDVNPSCIYIVAVLYD